AAGVISRKAHQAVRILIGSGLCHGHSTFVTCGIRWTMHSDPHGNSNNQQKSRRCNRDRNADASSPPRDSPTAGDPFKDASLSCCISSHAVVSYPVARVEEILSSLPANETRLQVQDDRLDLFGIEFAINQL